MTTKFEIQRLSESEFQRKTQQFVQREVICCVSILITALIAWSSNEQFYDFFEYFLRYDENDDPIEIFEYWFVSDLLGEKLAAKGEIVVEDFFGHTVWGRTCTGQAICMDHVIREIYTEIMQ